MRASRTFRVFVSTDLGGDPDDTQSLIHMLHYSDALKLEGLISTSGPGSTPRAENIAYWVKRADLDYLRGRGYPELMSETEVVGLVRQGISEPRAPVDGGAAAGTELLIECANRASDEILWVLVWGSMTDVAQALHDDPGIASKIRINYIGSSNTVSDPGSRDYVYRFMQEQFPDLWWIEDGVLPRFSRDTFRGYYLGGDQSGIWGNKSFVEHVIRGRGTTHESVTGQVLGDEFPLADWPEGTLKEGDTPTFLYLLSSVVGGVGNVDDPTVSNWGGQFHRPLPEQYPNYYCDLPLSAEECQQTINRWRVDYLSEWKTRWERYDTD